MEEENANYPIEFPSEPQPRVPTNLVAYVALILTVIGIGFGGFVFYKTTVLDKGQKSLSEELKSVSESLTFIESEKQVEENQAISNENSSENESEIGDEQDEQPVVNEDTVSSRDKTRKQDLKTIAAGLEKYKTANQSYPIFQGLEKLNNFESKTYKALTAGGHLAFMPKDPLDSEGRFYGYKSTADGKGYQLTASLEDKSDPEGKANGSLWLYILSANYSETQTQSNLSNKSNEANLPNSSNSTSGDSGDEETSEEDDSEEENFEVESGDEILE